MDQQDHRLSKPSLDVLADLCVKFVCDDSSWVARRKETVDVLNETTARRQLSVDFEFAGVAEAVAETSDGQSVHWVPLLLLRKAPAALTGFDFVDEDGRSLPLPLRADNAEISAATLERLAVGVLSTTSGGSTIPSPELRRQLRNIALEPDSNTAERLLEEISGPNEGDPDRTDKLILWESPSFQWLAESLAASSIVVVPIARLGDSRRVLKLSYDETLSSARQDWTKGRFRVLRRFSRRLLETLGWRGYVLYVASPFIGARTYHFELSAPEGVIITDGLLVEAQDVQYEPGPRSRVHFYVRDAEAKRQALAIFQFRIRAGGFVTGAWVTALIIALVLTACWHWADTLTGASNGAPAALLLFPSIVAAYVGRVGEHPLTARLLANARRLLFLAGALAYVGAARLAIISRHHPANLCGLRHLFLALAIAAWLALAALLATRRLPLSLVSPLRRLLGGRISLE
jgi:hypothetical protein